MSRARLVVMKALCTRTCCRPLSQRLAEVHAGAAAHEASDGWMPTACMRVCQQPWLGGPRSMRCMHACMACGVRGNLSCQRRQHARSCPCVPSNLCRRRRVHFGAVHDDSFRRHVNVPATPRRCSLLQVHTFTQHRPQRPAAAGQPSARPATRTPPQQQHSCTRCACRPHWWLPLQL